jgi:cytochrome b6-f complex iron-sulfur subunit
MSGEDQERFEDYLELEQFVEELQAGHVAHPPTELTPGQARIYRMAALFRSATPEAAEPRPEFAEELRARLEREIQQQQEQKPQRSKLFPFLKKKREQVGATGSGNGSRPHVSRRSLLAGGAAVAASLVAGAAIGHEIDQRNNNGQVSATPTPPGWPAPLIAAGAPTTWFPVTTVAELGDKVIRFATETVVGYVTFDDDEGKIIAISAACTHMGCIVQWQESDKRFHCPCHDAFFAEYGKTDPKSPLKYLTPLPRMNTRVIDGKILVEVPAAKS